LTGRYLQRWCKF